MISVIIPTYNRAPFLKEAIQSVLDQDYFQDSLHSFELEILVVDDGSTDETEEVVAAFEGPLRYVRREHQGVSASRNLGIRLARGEFIAFLDSDDLWKKKKIRIQMSFLETFPKAEVCYTEEVWIRSGEHLNPHQKHRKFSGWIFDKVLPLCLLSLSSCLFRRRVFDEIGLFDEELPVCEDYDFSIRLAHKHPIFLIQTPLIVKRGGHRDQLSHLYWGMDRFRVRALEKALSLGLTPEQERLVKAELVRKCEILVKGFEKRQNEAKAQKYRNFIKSMRGESRGR